MLYKLQSDFGGGSLCTAKESKELGVAHSILANLHTTNLTKKRMKAKIYVTLKNGVLDPQGSAILNSLKNLEIDNISSIRQGKFFEVELNEKSVEVANDTLKKACEGLLSNMVIENYKFDIE